MMPSGGKIRHERDAAGFMTILGEAIQKHESGVNGGCILVPSGWSSPELKEAIADGVIRRDPEHDTWNREDLLAYRVTSTGLLEDAS